MCDRESSPQTAVDAVLQTQDQLSHVATTDQLSVVSGRTTDQLSVVSGRTTDQLSVVSGRTTDQLSVVSGRTTDQLCVVRRINDKVCDRTT